MFDENMRDVHQVSNISQFSQLALFSHPYAYLYLAFTIKLSRTQCLKMQSCKSRHLDDNQSLVRSLSHDRKIVVKRLSVIPFEL